MAAVAAKVVFEAISRGTDMVPDKYWDRIPGMRPPKTEQEYKETKAKVDADEAKYGRFGSDQRRRGDKDRHGRQMADRQRNHKHTSTDHDRHRARRRSQSDERRPDRRRDHGLRAERRTLERRPSSYSPPPSEDEDFYNDVERRRQERRAQMNTNNDASHQQWGRRDQPAASRDRPYIHMPQPGGASKPPVSFTQNYSPPDSQRSSMHSSTASFTPQSSSPYTPVSAASSRPSSSQMNHHLPQQSAQAQHDMHNRVSPPTLPQQTSTGLESKAAQKYTPPGVVAGNEMYPGVKY